MDIGKSFNRFMTFLLKLYLAVLAVCIALQFLDSWIASIHFATATKVVFWLTLAAISVIAYFFRKSRAQSNPRGSHSHGAERTPLMPGRGGRP